MPNNLIRGEYKNDLEQLGIKGQVKEIIYLYFYIKNNEEQEKCSIQYICKFNKNGYVTEEMNYKTGDLLEWKIKYKYNIKNDLIEMKKYGPNEKMIEYLEFLPKTNNKMKAIIHKDEHNNMWSQEDVPFFHKGKKIDRMSWYAPINSYYILDYKYNTNRKITEITKKANNIIYLRWTIKYDENGNKIEEIQYLPDRIIVEKKIFTFNNENNMSNEQIYRLRKRSGKDQLILISRCAYKYKYWK